MIAQFCEFISHSKKNIYIYMIKRSLNLKLNMTVSARSYE